MDSAVCRSKTQLRRDVTFCDVPLTDSSTNTVECAAMDMQNISTAATCRQLYAGFHANAVGRVLGGHKVPLAKGAYPARQEVCAVEAGNKGQVTTTDQHIVVCVHLQLVVTPAWTRATLTQGKDLQAWAV